jgi:hypothetical protein
LRQIGLQRSKNVILSNNFVTEHFMLISKAVRSRFSSVRFSSVRFSSVRSSFLKFWFDLLSIRFNHQNHRFGLHSVRFILRYKRGPKLNLKCLIIEVMLSIWIFQVLSSLLCHLIVNIYIIILFTLYFLVRFSSVFYKFYLNTVQFGSVSFFWHVLDQKIGSVRSDRMALLIRTNCENVLLLLADNTTQLMPIFNHSSKVFFSLWKSETNN